MNRSIDGIVKQAKRTGKRVAQRLKQEQAPTLAKVCAQRDSNKEAPPLRVWGPYQEGESRFRLKISESGVERSLMFRTIDEAEEVKADLLRRHGGTVRRTIGEVIDEWLEWCVEVRGIKPITVENYGKMARRLPPSAVFGLVTEHDAKKLYQAQVERVSPHTKKPTANATHHLFLWVVKRLWAWAFERGYCKTNPWRKITAVGRVAAGKAQLRIDEARRLESVAIQQAQAGDVAALGTLLMIYLGLRQGEVAARVARDIDDGGRVLWVPSGKTKNARRRLKIPEHLHPLVLGVAQNKRPDELLFYPPTHKRHHCQFYVLRVRRLCRLAGVPEVVPHSLRGLHATLALEGGATADAVAKALGHSSFAMTEQHYASPSSVANNRSGRVAAALTVQKETLDDELIRLLKNTPSIVLSELVAQIAERKGIRESSNERCPV